MPDFGSEEYDKGLKYVLRLLSLRDRSEGEIRRKLLLKKYDTIITERVVTYLNENGFLNDERFACNWAQYRVENRAIGSLKLDQELRKKGIDEKLISKASQQVWLNHDEFSLAKSLASKKMARVSDNPSDKELKRVYDFLLRRGFPTDMVYKVISEFRK